MSAFSLFIDALTRADCRPKRTGPGRWQARCPAHDDRNPSLSVTQRDDRVLVYCHAGCTIHEVMEALRLQIRDLFDDDVEAWGDRYFLDSRYLYEGELGRELDELGGEPKRSDRRRIVIRSLREALNETADEPQWLWQGYVARGWLTLLVGPPKTGKTTILCALLDAFARHAPLLGAETAPTRVLLLTEQSPSVFKETLANFSLTFDESGVEAMFLREQPASLGWQDAIREAIEHCREHDIGLLVIDTYARWASFEHDHDAAEILRSMVPLGEAAEAGVAVLLVHHSRKEGGSHGIEVAGRTEIAGAVDVILSLKRNGENRKLCGDGRSMRTPAEVAFSLGPDGFEIVEGGPRPTDSVRDALARLGQATCGDLVADTGLSRTTVQRALEQLEAREAGKRGRAILFEI